jgi:hypothetical protein
MPLLKHVDYTVESNTHLMLEKSGGVLAYSTVGVNAGERTPRRHFFITVPRRGSHNYRRGENTPCSEYLSPTSVSPESQRK